MNLHAVAMALSSCTIGKFAMLAQWSVRIAVLTFDLTGCEYESY